ncbi:MAG: phenylalanine--tRNA ligase subunit beta [Actinomycetia bacterium]|nr:phenylalanine--tRNA ligase subunit beta [Actinomycetes bacterium]MCP4084609.1 phenylalanine--tRNA ligase subunit beta [Actinomycetes bacterium]
MKVLLSWMQEFAPEIAGDPIELGEQLSDLGLAVEELKHLGGGLGGIVVARVLDLRKHPDADRIQLVDVDAGDGEALQICCGAFNMSVGDLVPLATIGATMPNGMEIAKRKMRGQTSNGMLCSGAELDLGDDHDGIMVLNGDLAPGTAFAEAMGIEPDVLFDLEVNPNRPDAMSIAGVSRDLAARLCVPFNLPDPTVPAMGSIEGRTSVEVHDSELCPRFGSRVLDGVSVGQSPAWMSQRLLALGMRPINNLVDISNYVMLELGQPNHTYDLDLVPDGHLGVRMARDGDRLTTLDDTERNLIAADGVIVNRADEPIGLAGVMGGASTEISESTTSAVVEAAVWHRIRIAKTARRLNLRSEASARFEKGVDPGGIELALDRFAELAVAAGATAAEGTLVSGPAPVNAPIRVRTHRVNELIGVDLQAGTMKSLLDPIGFETELVDGDLDVTIPTFRPDSDSEIDIIEEVARCHSYSKVAKTVPSSPRSGHLTRRQLTRRRLRSALTGLGLSEAMPLPFLAPGDLTKTGLADDGIVVANPLVAEESIMRTSLLPGMVKAVATNQRHRNGNVALFEIGNTFADEGGELPHETEHVVAVLAGDDASAAVGLWQALAGHVHVPGSRLVDESIAGLHPSRAARVEIDDVTVAVVGEIDPAVLERWEVEGRVAWLDIDLDAVLGFELEPADYLPVSRYPSSDIDLAFEVADGCPAQDLEATLREAGGDLLASLQLFDVYRGTGLPEGTRSLAFGLRLQATDRTLTDDEVASVRQRCIEVVEIQHPARLRG